MRSRYRGQLSEAVGHEQRIKNRAHFFREDALRAYNNVLRRQGKKPARSIPKSVERAIEIWQGRQLSYIHEAKETGQKLTPKDKLLSDLKFLSRHFGGGHGRAKF